MFRVKQPISDLCVERGDLIVVNTDTHLLAVRFDEGLKLIVLNDDCNRFIDEIFEEKIPFKFLKEKLMELPCVNNARLIKNDDYILTLGEEI